MIKVKRVDHKIDLVFVRSGFIGDICVILPYVFYYINYKNLNINNVLFICFQKSNYNSKKTIDIFKSILGETINSATIGDYNIIQLRKSLRDFNIDSRAQFVYLPFVKESKWSIFKKKIFLNLSGVPIFSIRIPKGSKRNFSEYSFFFTSSLDMRSGVNELRRFVFKDKTIELKDAIVSDFIDSVVLHINSQFEIKRWPLNSYVDLVNKLSDLYGFKFVLIGSDMDYNTNSHFYESIKNANVKDYTNKLSIFELLQYLRHSKLFIGNDGGPMHLAALSGVKVLSFFTLKEEFMLWDPIITNFVTLRKNVFCKTCNLSFCEQNICVSTISISSALQGVKDLVEGKSYSLIEF